MEKFLKVTLSDTPIMIPVKSILHIELGADQTIQVLYNIVGFPATTASQVVGVSLTAATATTTAKTKEQLTAFANLMEEALTMPWTKPVLDITSKLPYAITGFGQIEEEWSV
jgi:hypothetical protein